LSLEFSLVYAKSKTAIVSVSDVWNGGHINFYLTRGASFAMRAEKAQLITILNYVRFTYSMDFAVWMWESHGIYTIKFMYIFYALVVLSLLYPSRFGPLKYLL
jgi:hypothetical protein